MRNLKIKYRITFFFIVLIVCFSVANSIAFLKMEYKSETTNYKIIGTSIVRNIEPYLAELLYVNDLVGLKRIISGIIKSNPDILYAFILSTENKVVVHSFTQSFPADLLKVNTKPVQNIELIEHDNLTIYDFSYPLVDGKLGIIRIGLSSERLMKNIEQSILKRTFLLLVFIVLGTGTAFYIGRLIINPLSELVDSAEKISNGDFSHQISIRSNDEIGALSASFNNMCNSLKKLTHNLEEKIELLNQRNEEYLTLNKEYEKQNKALTIAKDKAEECDRLKTAFLNNMSHEIRTPMNAIVGFSQLLPQNMGNKEKLTQFSNIINQRCNDLLEIINDILDIAKIESGQLLVKYENCIVPNLFSELKSYFQIQQVNQNKKHIHFEMLNKSNISDIKISTDQGKLKQIFVNLLSNAFKYTEKGKIEGGCLLNENKQLIFYVSDTGIGIPHDKHQYIFERFTRIETNASYINSGTGLGLSIVKGLVNLLGGEIWLESEPDIGSTFFFTIENSNSIQTTTYQKKQIAGLSHYHFENKKVLVVEDDPYNMTLIKEILSDSGLTLYSAEKGDEAIKMALEVMPDLVLMDIGLPDMSGYDATRRIHYKNSSIKIIAQTAYTSAFDREKALESGCLDHITKPLKSKDLLSTIANYL